MDYKFSGQLQEMIDRALHGSSGDIDYIMTQLTVESSLAVTRYVDFALSLVEKPSGVERIRHYLFEGSQIQRNYACLFFGRLNEWNVVKEAYEKGLVDETQAYAR